MMMVTSLKRCLIASIVPALLLAAQASAQEPAPAAAATPAPPSQPGSAPGERLLRLKLLLDKRNEAFKQYEERKTVPETVDFVASLFSGCGGGLMGGGAVVLVTGGAAPVGYGTIACGACLALTGLGTGIANMMLDHRKDDLAEVNRIQEEMDGTVMQY